MTATTAHSASETIAPYDTGLNGVSQENNFLFKDLLWLSLGTVGMVILVVRTAQLCWKRLRLVSAMSVPGDRQTYWKLTQWSWLSSLKKHIIYAPLGTKRHNRELRLSKAMNMGTLPSRLHAMLMGLYLASNVAYIFILNWRQENKFALRAELRGRTGTLSAVNMVPLVIFAGRNNPLVPLLQISFNTYNFYHRWLGRIAVIEALLHMAAWASVQVPADGWESVRSKLLDDTFCASGFAGTLAMLFILILSLSPVRHAFYETFLNSHIMLAFIVFVCTLIHCVSASIPGGLPQLPWMVAVMMMWFLDRLARMVRLMWCNYAHKTATEAIVEPMPGEACRVTMHLPRHVDVRPGTHAYVRFSSVNPWENHPFSIAWVEHAYEEPELPVHEKDIMGVARPPVSTSVSFVIGAQTGFTRKLYNTVKASGERAVHMKALFEGPYAGHHSLDSYGHAVLVAGATGITHQISYLKHLIQGYENGTVATRRVTLIWIVRDYEALEWVRPWMDKILHMRCRKDVLRIKLFVTRPKNSRETASASNTVQMFPGRPNIPMLLAKEVSEQMGAMAVSVCGPGALQDDVMAAVRVLQSSGHVISYGAEEFNW